MWGEFLSMSPRPKPVLESNGRRDEKPKNGVDASYPVAEGKLIMRPSSFSNELTKGKLQQV
jgi:hypothetical protein